MEKRSIRLGTALFASFVITSSAQAQTLKTQKFPDGTGQIGVAAGWKLADSGSGGAILSGPGGAAMTLGQFRTVFAHNFDRMTLTPGVNPEVPRVHLNDPVVATMDMFAILQKQGILSQVKLKAIERAPGFGMPAAFLRYSGTMQGKPMEFYGLYLLAQTDHTTGSYFYSVLMAPPGSFSKQLPTMNAMWKSWSLSPRRFTSAWTRRPRSSARSIFPAISTAASSSVASSPSMPRVSFRK